MKDGKFEEIELYLTDLFCDLNKASVDIGTTGAGPYTDEMLRHSKEVYSYEPHPASAKRMREKFGDSITLREYAVSNKVGTAILSTPVRENRTPDQSLGKPALSSIYKDFGQKGVEAERNSVKTTTIDSENLPPLALIKIDVEGAEIEVLEGAIKTIEKYRPVVIIEMDEQHRAGTLKTNTSFLESLDYSGFYIENLSIHSIHAFIENARVNHSMDIGTGNIYNFFFIPKEKTDVLQKIQERLPSL